MSDSVPTRFEWDENKRLANVEKHGIDFVDVVASFHDPQGFTYRSSRDSDEVRLVRVVNMNGRLVAAIFTQRAGVIRMISARAARRNERQIYGQQDFS